MKDADTFVGAISKVIRHPLSNLKQIRDLTRLDDEDESIMWALKNVSFEVPEGEVLGIIGHNGAGKSTLLKILSRITEPSHGEVLIRGRVAALLEVGTGFHPELTGRENIYMNGTILGMRKKEIDKKLDEIVNFSGVEKYLDTPVKFYSSGMRVRLGFSVAAHLEPEILIIDEVLSVGDAEFQKKCLGKMENVAKQGRTVLFVSHNMTAIQNLCNRSIVLNKGELVFAGLADQGISFYLQNFRSNKSSFSVSDSNENENEAWIKAGRVKDADKLIAGGSVELEFVVECASLVDINIGLTFHLYDELGNMLFASGSAEDQEFLIRNSKLILRSVIPPGLLQEGAYSVSRLLLVKNRGQVIQTLSDVLSFELKPQRVERLGWMGKKEGLIKPKILWEVTYD